MRYGSPPDSAAPPGDAALAAAVAVTSGCGGGNNAQAAAKTDRRRLTYSSSSQLQPPGGVEGYPFRRAGELHFRPMVYLSTQPVQDPCSTREHDVVRLPGQQLEPGGVLVDLERGIPLPRARVGLADPGRRPRRQARGHGRRDLPQDRRRPDDRRPDRSESLAVHAHGVHRLPARAGPGAEREERRRPARVHEVRSRSSSRALERRSWSD